MTDSAERARIFQERAKELGAIAAELHDEEQRRLLRSLAEEYEHMAAKILLSA